MRPPIAPTGASRHARSPAMMFTRVEAEQYCSRTTEQAPVGGMPKEQVDKRRIRRARVRALHDAMSRDAAPFLPIL